jgi:hypothetical protein
MVAELRRPKSTKTTKERVMIVDDNFAGIIMFALIGVIYLAYKVGEYVGEMTQQQEKREQ